MAVHAEYTANPTVIVGHPPHATLRWEHADSCDAEDSLAVLMALPAKIVAADSSVPGTLNVVQDTVATPPLAPAIGKEQANATQTTSSKIKVSPTHTTIRDGVFVRSVGVVSLWACEWTR